MTPRESVLTLMARGHKDEAVARQLGMSVRTVRRHIAEYSIQVGAGNRFQAGAVWAVHHQALTREHMTDMAAGA